MTRFLTLILLLATVPLDAAMAADGVARYRTNRMEERISRLPAELQQGIFAEPDRNLEPLVRALVAGVDDDFLKAKLLHDWLADNIAYDVPSYLSGATVDSAWQQTLRRRQAVCYGYSGLMARMCSLAGIPCETISGYGRGYGYSLRPDEDVNQVNHAWNAVQLGGRWYLLDVTWDAGHVEGRAYRKRYSTAYLFLEPRRFLYSHLPSESKWQLLEEPFTPQQFAALPYLRGRFFEDELRLATPLARVSRAGQSVQFTIEAPRQVELMASLKAPDGSKIERRTLLQREGTTCRILATFPRAGRWKVELYSKQRSAPGKYLAAASLEFEASKGTTAVFPETYGFGAGEDGYLLGPLYLPLPTNRPVPFRVCVHGSNVVHLVVGKSWQRMSPVPGQADVYQFTTPVSPGAAVKITAKAPGRGSHRTLIDFSPPSD